METNSEIIEEFKYYGCDICGYNKCAAALCVHHILPSEKVYAPNMLKKRSVPARAVRQELDKCMVLCANCHAEVHEQIRYINKQLKSDPDTYMHSRDIRSALKQDM